MRILLFDADMPTKARTRKRRKTPNLALMKISAWHKAHGDQVELNFTLGHFDRIYASCVFPKNRKRILEHLPSDAIVGGSGWDLGSVLPPEIEHIMPDYSLYGADFSMGFTSRGCIRRCPWCVVPEKEGGIEPWASIYEFWDRRHTEIMLIDNNLLAAPNWKETLVALARERLRVDFNQGLDIRLVDKEKAYYLAKVRLWAPLRFSFDFPGMRDAVIQGVNLLERRGISAHRLRFYVLVGYNTSFDEDMERFKLLKGLGCECFPMIYQDENGVEHRPTKGRVFDRDLPHGSRWAIRRYVRWATGLPHGAASIRRGERREEWAEGVGESHLDET